jgi:hypothetical protein
MTAVKLKNPAKSACEHRSAIYVGHRHTPSGEARAVLR